MGRKKKVQRFDFSGMKYWRNPQEYLTEKYNATELVKEANDWLTRASSEGKYVSNYIRSYISDAKQDGWGKLMQYAKDVILRELWTDKKDVRDEYNAKFMEWYNNTPDAQEVYKYAAPLRWYWNETNELGHRGPSIQPDEAKARGIHDAPRDCVDFLNVMEMSDARGYMENNREQVFEEGDIVVLRKPFIGNWSYDPHVSNSAMTKDDMRYGTVMEQGTGALASHRAGKGSRIIKVMWFGKSITNDVPERILKFESRKGRQ